MSLSFSNMKYRCVTSHKSSLFVLLVFTSITVEIATDKQQKQANKQY